MKIHVELAKIILKEKHHKAMAFYMALRVLFPNGKFLMNHETKHLIIILLGCSKRTVNNYLKQALTLKYIRGHDNRNFFYLNSYQRIVTAYNVKTESVFELEQDDLKDLKTILFSAYLQHLLKWKRKHQGNHGINKFQSTTKVINIDDLDIHKPGFQYPQTVLPLRYITKIMGISLNRADSLKRKLVKKGFLKVKPSKMAILFNQQMKIKERQKMIAGIMNRQTSRVMSIICEGSFPNLVFYVYLGDNFNFKRVFKFSRRRLINPI